MDVMVQHHPEYVSLAWGAMKIVFGVRKLLQVSKNIANHPVGHHRARKDSSDHRQRDVRHRRRTGSG